MPGEFDSRKDSQSTKFEQRLRIFVKLSFRELCDLISGLHPFDNMPIIHGVENKKVGSEIMRHQSLR